MLSKYREAKTIPYSVDNLSPVNQKLQCSPIKLNSTAKVLVYELLLREEMM